MEKVRITFVQERNGKNGPYTRVGFKNGSGSSTFVNVDGHGLGLAPGKEALWDPEKKRFLPLAEEKGPEGTDSEARIRRTSALYAAVQVYAAQLQAGLVSLDKSDPKEEILKLAREFEAFLAG